MKIVSHINVRWIVFIFDMMIDTGLKFYSAILTVLAHGLKVKVKDLEILY